MNIYVTNLSVHVMAADLSKLFAAFGDVTQSIIIRDKDNGRSLGIAIVDMPNDAQASQALMCLNNTIIDGKAIQLQVIRQSGGDRQN